MTFEAFMGNLGGIVAGRVTDLFSDNISPVKAEQDAQAAGNADRNRIYAQNQALSTGFNGEYANTVVPPVIEPFVGMPHSRITQFISKIDLDQMWTSVDSWQKLAKKTMEKGDTYQADTKKEMDKGWSGSAAASALASVQAYIADVEKVEQAANLIANKMEEAFTGFSQVTYQVPHESEAREGGKLAGVVSAIGDAVLPGSPVSNAISSNDAGRQKNAEDLANEVMRTVYKPVALQADAQVPKVPSPTTPAARPDADVPVNKGGNGDGNGNGNPTSPKSGDPKATDPAATDPASTDPASTNPASTNPASSNPASTNPASTNPASTNPATTTNPTGTNPVTANPNRLGTGTPRTGTGTPSSGTPGTPKSVAGTGNTPAAAAAANSGKANSAAARSGMPGMGAPGRGNNNNDDESEHKAPDYLYGVHEELLGPDRKAVPPVIGGEA
ncbi:hypothetical protein [Nocardia sp. NPDC048505]|uniref:PPE domain-containing protein n=1 Tax=unclassified Nocardia TaxID=2637762 RepID=UPI0033C6B9C1